MLLGRSQGVFMNEQDIRSFARQSVTIICAALLASFSFGLPLTAQDAMSAPAPEAQQPAPFQQLTSDQLDDLVAPIALYPDPLLSQVLVASTYPLEVMEASQWLQQNQGLQGQALLDAARQQNWDPSVQALVAFPDVLSRFASNVSWTTALGNAFLAQQADVMNAVQLMRARAQANGRLSSDPEQTVTTQTQNGQAAIDIVPANPQVIYVPQYNPAYIWGPPAWGYYPDLYYPAVSYGFGFYPGIYVNSLFFGWGGWGGWGWGPNWFGSSIFLNTGFFNRYGFGNFYGVYGRGGIWAHNPYHRLGVPYPNERLGQRFGGNYIARGGGIHAGAGIGAQRGAGFAGGQFRGSQSFAAGRNGGNWQRFSGSTGAPRGGAVNGGQFRGSQSFAGGGGQRFQGSSGAAASGAFNGANRVAPQGQSFGRSSSQGFAGSGRSFGNTPAYRSPSFSGSRGFSNSQSSSRSFSGASRSFGGGGGSSFSGGGARSFGGGGSRSFGGGGSQGGGGGSHSGGGHGGRR